MVKIAVAGGSGSTSYRTILASYHVFNLLVFHLTVANVEIACEIINALVATKKHEILILSRRVRALREASDVEASIA
jgi:hypothetical protein